MPDITLSPLTAFPALAEELEAAALVLGQAGVYDPRRESAALWGALVGMRPGEVWLHRQRSTEPAALARFRTAVRQRAQGVPFAYVIGRVAFRTLDLAVDPRALIPRPETEGLVELVLEWLRARGGEGGLAADIGTGTGCIALSLAMEGSFERVIAVDSSPAAANLARENVARVRPPVPVEVRVGHLLAPLGGERYRVIVANPPYLTEGEWAALDPAVREFEPKAALVSGSDGLAATGALFAGAKRLLAPDGGFALEIDERRAESVRALARGAGWRRVDIHRDLFGRVRYALAV